MVEQLRQLAQRYSRGELSRVDFRHEFVRFMSASDQDANVQNNLIESACAAFENGFNDEVTLKLRLRQIAPEADFVLPLGGVSDWQPIETAPKDGTWILLRGESGYINRPYRAHVGRWATSGDPRDGGWWEQSEDDYFHSDGDEPTHWMPLPDPPVPERER